MAVDLVALKAALVARETLESTSAAKFPTEDEATQDAIVLAAQTIWALIDDIEAANTTIETQATRIVLLARTATDSRLQQPKQVRYPRA